MTDVDGILPALIGIAPTEPASGWRLILAALLIGGGMLCLVLRNLVRAKRHRQRSRQQM